jgi:uncharacterized membrane protein (UPF0127 family)
MFSRGRTVSVFNDSKGTALAGQVRVLDFVLGRLIGLLGRRSLQPETGVWLFPANSIHTFGMLFRFDAVLIDRKHRVVGVRERIRPFWATWPNFRAHSVLELPAFTIRRSRTETGDQLRIENNSN